MSFGHDSRRSQRASLRGARGSTRLVPISARSPTNRALAAQSALDASCLPRRRRRLRAVDRLRARPHRLGMEARFLAAGRGGSCAARVAALLAACVIEFARADWGARQCFDRRACLLGLYPWTCVIGSSLRRASTIADASCRNRAGERGVSYRFDGSPLILLHGARCMHRSHAATRSPSPSFSRPPHSRRPRTSPANGPSCPTHRRKALAAAWALRRSIRAGRDDADHRAHHPDGRGDERLQARRLESKNTLNFQGNAIDQVSKVKWDGGT